MARFVFTGTCSLAAQDSKNPALRTGKTKDGKDYKTFNLGVASAKNNRAFCELFGMKQTSIKTKDVDGNDIEIDVSDVHDADVLKTVAGYKKHVFSDGDDRKEFIYDYEFVEALATADLDGKMITVTGQVQKNIYKGKITDRFTIQNVYLVADDTKPKMQIIVDEFFTSEDIDLADWKDEKKVYLNGHTTAYIDKYIGTKYVDQQLVFDASKIDFANEKHVKLAAFKLKQFGVSLDGEKVTVSLKKNKVYRLGFVCNYVSGQEEIPFDESTLTDNQKMAIELGMKTLDDFKPKGSIFGERVILYKIVDFNLIDDASDGCYDAGISVKDFEDEFYSAPQEESLDEVVAKAESSVTVNEPSDDELDDLFG